MDRVGYCGGFLVMQNTGLLTVDEGVCGKPVVDSWQRGT